MTNHVSRSTTAARPVAPDRSAAAVELSGITKSFGPVRALDGLDITFHAGETVALLGPNGAGKTTAVEIMLGLQRADSGQALLFGAAPRTAVRRGQVGAMLQTGNPPGLVTVAELVRAAAATYPGAPTTEATLAAAGIEDIADRRVEKLSGGQRQRLRFALAIAGDPHLLFLDEPTVAMDVGARRAFWETVRERAARGRSVIFATHYLDEADAVADRIVVLARGKVVADGPATAIKAGISIRIVRATLDEPDERRLLDLPGLADVTVHGTQVELRCNDADATLRALLARQPDARDIEVTGAGLEEAFLQLTGEH